jgi:hypothetical protein
MVDIRVIGFTELTDDHTTTIHYDILLPRPYAVDPSLVRQDLVEGVLRKLTSRDQFEHSMLTLVNSSVAVSQTEILVTAADIDAIKLTGIKLIADFFITNKIK